MSLEMTSSTGIPSNTNKMSTNFSIESIMSESQKQPPSKSSKTNDSSNRHPNESNPIKQLEMFHNDKIIFSGYDTQAKTSRPKQEEPDTQEKSPAKKHRPKNFKCPACRMAFSNNGQLKNHVRIHTGERPFRCSHGDCNKSFTRNEELTRHKMIHTGVRPHTCTTCGKRFGRKDHLKKHIRTHERKRQRKLFSNPSSTDPIQAKRSLKHSTFDSSIAENPQLTSPTAFSDIFTATKAITNSISQGTSIFNLTPIGPANFQSLPITSPSTTLIEPQLMPIGPVVTSAQIIPHLSNSAFPSSLRSCITTPVASIQQFAADYWRNWYDLLGFYHQPNPTLNNINTSSSRGPH